MVYFSESDDEKEKSNKVAAISVKKGIISCDMNVYFVYYYIITRHYYLSEAYI